MKPGRFAADDSSFAKSAGGAGVRGLALLAVAVLIGIVFLNATDADPPGTTISANGDSDTPSGDGGASDAAGEGTVDSTTIPPTTTVPAHAPKDVKVIVANASAVKGAAGNAKKVLDPLGFNMLSPANAAPVAESSVFYTAGYERDAAALAAALGLPGTTVKAIPTPLPYDTKGANVAIVIGADHASKFAAAPTTGGSTTTTAAGAAGASGAGSGGSTTTTAAGAGSTASTTTTKKP